MVIRIFRQFKVPLALQGPRQRFSEKIQTRQIEDKHNTALGCARISNCPLNNQTSRRANPNKMFNGKAINLGTIQFITKERY